MKVEQRDGSVEKKIVTSLIVNTEVVARIAARWQKEGLLKSDWSNLIAGWCVDYYNEYGEAPGKEIESIYASWAGSTQVDKDTAKLVERYLEGISDEYEQKDINKDYVLDVAEGHINNIQALKLAEAIEGDIQRGKGSAALERIKAFNEVTIGTTGIIDVFQDKEAIKDAFSDSGESIIAYSGALGKMFRGETLGRDQFIAFMAPDKTGKSFWLQDLAFRALMQRRRVLVFQCGDLTRRQAMRRLMIRNSRRPRYPTEIDKPVLWPTGIIKMPDEQYAECTYEELQFKKAINWKVAWEDCQRAMARRVKSKEALFKLSVHPADSINASQIKSIAEGLAREGWEPDVIIIDYADLLAPINGRDDNLHQINKTWMALRALSQTLHCLVITATQANANAYGVDLITRKNFSGNKLKMAHVTAMLGINVAALEKERQICRLNFVVLREDEFSSTRCVHVAGCLPLGNIAVKSTW